MVLLDFLDIVISVVLNNCICFEKVSVRANILTLFIAESTEDVTGTLF